MNKTVVFLLGLLIGGTAGYLGGKKVAEDDLEDRIREEVSSVKKAFRKKYRKPEKKEEEKPAPEKPKDEAPEAPKEKTQRMREYREAVVENGYSSPEKVQEEIRPRVIDPNEVGEEESYGEAIELSYFPDDVLMETGSNTVYTKEQIEESVGLDFADHFGEYEEDEVDFVNDKQKAYYVILKQAISFAEHRKRTPYMQS